MEPLDRADLIYHETQEGALCGVHALNTLLQAPHFSELDLASIAHELDAAERELMGGTGLEGHGNLDDSGMFSSQVLARALEVFGLQAVPLRSPDAAAARADPTTQEAFICNLQEHWFTVRSILGQWWNLNSVYGSPEPLSAFHLAAYLGSLQEEGYTIFVITGGLPPPQLPASEEERAMPGLAGRWFTPEEARAATEERKQLKEQGYAKATAQGVLGKASDGQGTWLVLRRPGAKRALEEGEGQRDDMQGDDPELAQALAASLADHPGGRAQPARSAWGAPRAPPAQHADDEDADLAAAIAASLADGGGGDPQQAQQQQQQQQAGSSGAGDMMHVDDDEDPELAAAIAASLQHQQTAQQPAAEQPAVQQPAAAETPTEQHAAGEAHVEQQQWQLPELGAEPEAGAEGAIEVAIRLPGGSRASRRFLASEDTVGHLAAFAAAKGAAVAGGRGQLAAGFPRRVLADWGASLAAAGVGHKELVTVEPL